MIYLGIDPSYRKIGVAKLKCHPVNKNIKLSTDFYFIENKTDNDHEDYFLYSLSKFNFLNKTIGEKAFVIIEYTFVPYLKPMMAINRVIGTLLASLHENIDGWVEINMNAIYSYFGINSKLKSQERKKLLKEKVLKKIHNDKLTLTTYTIENEQSKMYVKGIKTIENELPEDCLDAYALIEYVRDKFL